MKSAHLVTLAGLSLLASVSAAQAGPCTDQITELRKTLASTDAGAGPTMKGTPAEPSATGATAPAGADVAATPSQTPKAGELPGTEATAAMSTATQGRATSPQDVRAQTQGQPTSSQVAAGAPAGSDRVMQAQAALERATMADEKGDATACNSAVGDARRILGNP
jgi:hypothetical protein